MPGKPTNLGCGTDINSAVEKKSENAMWVLSRPNQPNTLEILLYIYN